MSTIILKNQNQEITHEFVFGNCGISHVYLSGLKEGEAIISEEPYLIQNVNGIIAGIDQRFKAFKVVSNNQVIDSIDLEWNDSCTASIQTMKSDPSLNGIDRLGNIASIPAVLILLITGFALIIQKIRK